MTERLYKISADVDLEIRATSKKAIEKSKKRSAIPRHYKFPSFARKGRSPKTIP